MSVMVSGRESLRPVARCRLCNSRLRDAMLVSLIAAKLARRSRVRWSSSSSSSSSSVSCCCCCCLAIVVNDSMLRAILQTSELCSFCIGVYADGSSVSLSVCHTSDLCWNTSVNYFLHLLAGPTTVLFSHKNHCEILPEQSQRSQRHVE